ncbi:hypothetical protein QCA50_013928 [Cerrena zonata]|uniref:Luciferase-like domain-containing protein n=1 Tax=Cerrena zonata TaxID=2478898 RepID=A0AAW0FQ61_9APHY
MGCPGLQCPGLWKHPKDKSRNYNTIEYWTNLAKTLERGKFNALFIADVLGGYDVFNGPQNLTAAAKSGAQWPINEPSAVVSAMAAVTKNLSFAITFSTISEAPYHFARRLATLDHLTNGRVGWNVVSSYLDSAARNLLNNQPLPPHTERYERAQEYIEIIYDLFLSSWSDDAIKVDPKTGVFADAERIRQINYEGKHFNVPGPSITEPTPQRLPVILQAGTSKQGTEFAARNAEAVFVNDATPEGLGIKIKGFKDLIKQQGRSDKDVKFLQLITVVLGDTHEEAIEKLQEYKSYSDLDGAQALFGGWTGIDIGQYGWDQELKHVESNAVRGFVEKWTKVLPGESGDIKKTREFVANQISIGGFGSVFYGTPKEVADEIERWVDISDLDGFNITYTITPGAFEEVVDKLIPELRSRGLVWDDYPKDGITFREQIFGTEGEDPTYLRSTHPAYELRWKAGESKEELEERIQSIKQERFNIAI